MSGEQATSQVELVRLEGSTVIERIPFDDRQAAEEAAAERNNHDAGIYQQPIEARRRWGVHVQGGDINGHSHS